MDLVTLGEDLAAVAVGASNEMNTTPTMEKHNVIGEIVPDAAFAGTAKIQGSDDNVTFVDLLTITDTAGKKAGFLTKRYMRVNVTARTAGTCSAYLTGA